MFQKCGFKSLIIFTIFLLGLIYYTNNNLNNEELQIENFENQNRQSINNKPRCPNLLVQKGAKLFLENTNVERVPGVNPIEFNNLEEYKNFIKWQHSQNIYCPVLFLQQTEGPQGKALYKIQPSVLNPQGGLNPLYPKAPPSLQYPYNDANIDSSLLYDAARNDPPFNKDSYPGYDQENQYIGVDVPLDQMKTPTTDSRVGRYKSAKKKSKSNLNALMNERLQERDELLSFMPGNESNRLVDNNPLNQKEIPGLEIKEDIIDINEFSEQVDTKF